MSKKIIMQIFVLLLLSGVVFGFTSVIRDTTTTLNTLNATRITIQDSGTNISYYHVNTTNVYASNFYRLGTEINNLYLGISDQRYNNSDINTSTNINNLFVDDLTTDDDTTYTADETNITLDGTVFRLLSLDLAELDNSVSAFITNAVSTLTNYYTKTEIQNMNGTWDADLLDGEDGSYYLDNTDYCSGGTCTGNIIINGNITILGDEIIANVTTQKLNGSFLPQLTNTFDIGSSSLLWANIYSTLIYRGTTEISELYADIAGVVNKTTQFGGEVSGTYDNIVIGNDVLDDQYYELTDKVGNTTEEIFGVVNNNTFLYLIDERYNDTIYVDDRVNSINNGTVLNDSLLITESQISDLQKYLINGTDINISNLYVNETYIGREEGDHYIYFYDGGSPTGENIHWNEQLGAFEFSENIVTQGLSATGVINTNSNIYTSGAGDDLWLGTPTQANAKFRAYANGDLYFVNLINGSIGWGNLTGVPSLLTNESFIGHNNSIINYVDNQIGFTPDYNALDIVNQSMFDNTTIIRTGNISWIIENQNTVLNDSLSITESQISDLQEYLTNESFVGHNDSIIDYVDAQIHVNGTDINITNFFVNNTYIGNKEESYYIYFYQGGDFKGEYLSWDRGGDRFLFSNDLYLSDGLTVQDNIQATLDLVSSRNIYTIGTGDDLWLGTSTQANSKFRAYANGDLYFVNLINGSIGWGNLTGVPSLLTNESFVGHNDSIIDWVTAQGYSSSAMSVGDGSLFTDANITKHNASLVLYVTDRINSINNGTVLNDSLLITESQISDLQGY